MNASLIEEHLLQFRKMLNDIWDEKNNDFRQMRVEGLMIALEAFINSVLGKPK